MGHSHDRRAAAERRLLCGIAFVCYSATLSSLAALGYTLCVLALSAAGHTAAALNFPFAATP